MAYSAEQVLNWNFDPDHPTKHIIDVLQAEGYSPVRLHSDMGGGRILDVHGINYREALKRTMTPGVPDAILAKARDEAIKARTADLSAHGINPQQFVGIPPDPSSPSTQHPQQSF